MSMEAMDCTGEIAFRPERSPLGHLNVRFPGQYFDAESGMHYNRFRYYDPETGRYVSADPIGQMGGANLYVYGRLNPVAVIDPLGLLSQEEIDCILEKLSEFFGMPFLGYAGPFAGMMKSSALMGLGGTMVVGGVGVVGAGAVMTGGGAPMAGVPTMVAGGMIGSSGAGLAWVAKEDFEHELHEAVEIFTEECKLPCDEETACCEED